MRVVCVLVALSLSVLAPNAMADAGDGEGFRFPPAPLRIEAAPRDAHSPAHDAAIDAAIADGLRSLGLDRAAADKNPFALILPLAPNAPAGPTDRHGISNFFDHNAAFPGFLRDHECGERTYDTAAGYNHAGTDYFIWPFPWQGMAQNAMQVRAAAGGIIVARADGFPDRNCSFDAADLPNYIAIRHTDGTVGRYLHLKRGSLTSKQLGKTVEAGEYLGMVGSSGISTGPHLHFELRNVFDAPIDPYVGFCNVAPGRWAEQPPYRDSRLLAVATHHAPPQASPGCGEVETPNYHWRFAPGDDVFLTAYFRDLRRGDPLRVELFRPDGSLQSRLDLDTSGMEAEYYSGAYWYVSTELAASAPAGMWTARYTYLGRSVESRFAVGDLAVLGSGAWYDPAQSGQGLVIEAIDSGGEGAGMAVAFYSYLDGQPVWMAGAGAIEGEVASVPLFIGSGPQFPPAFRPGDLDLEPWGELRLEFTEPDRLEASWESELEGFGNGSLSMRRLTTLADANADDFDSGLRACVSGSWYNPEESGYGLQVQAVDTEQGRLAAVVWYVYRAGQPYWLNGAAMIPADGVLTVTLEDGSGGDFPPDFDPADVQRQLWGEIDFVLHDSQNATLSWRTSRPGFPSSGEIPLRRLTQTLEASCR